MFLAVTLEKVGTLLGTEQAANGRHGARGVVHMNHGVGIPRRDLDRRVRLTGRGAANQQREPAAGPFQFPCHMNHLVQRWSYQPTQADDVNILFTSLLENPFAGRHDAQVDDLVIIAA